MHRESNPRPSDYESRAWTSTLNSVWWFSLDVNTPCQTSTSQRCVTRILGRHRSVWMIMEGDTILIDFWPLFTLLIKSCVSSARDVDYHVTFSVTLTGPDYPYWSQLSSPELGGDMSGRAGQGLISFQDQSILNWNHAFEVFTHKKNVGFRCC